VQESTFSKLPQLRIDNLVEPGGRLRLLILRERGAKDRDVRRSKRATQQRQSRLLERSNDAGVLSNDVAHSDLPRAVSTTMLSEGSDIAVPMRTRSFLSGAGTKS
jgi:hypothetical protein